MELKKEEKHYFKEINIMRGMAVLCVVIGHSFIATDTPTILGFLTNFVYIFHMPAFFFISGFLVKDQQMNWHDKITKIFHKAKRLMVPYIFLTLITIGLKILFGAFARNPLNKSSLIVDVLVGRNNPNGGLWFLYALFVISIIGILFNEIDKKVMSIGTFILYLLNVFVFKQTGYILGFFLNNAWFYFGGTVFRKYCYERIKESSIIKSNAGKVATLIISLFFIAIAFFKIYYYGNRFLSLLLSVIGVFLLFIIAMEIEYSDTGKKLWMLLGDYGMDIYMIGYYVQQTIYVLLGKLLGVNYFIYTWCMCIFGLIVPIIISKYIVRKNKALSLLVLGR